MAIRESSDGTRAEFVRVAALLIAENGIDRFSVSATARRAGFSAAAPYRHFPDRVALLAAVATSAARELYELARRWAKEEPDPAGQAAAIAAAHTRYLIDHRVGMDVFFAATFESPSFSELHRERRNLVNVLLAPCEMLCREHEEAVELVGQLHAQSHGFGALFLSGCYGHRRDVVVAKAKSAAQTMVAAHSRTAPDRFPLANG